MKLSDGNCVTRKAPIEFFFADRNTKREEEAAEEKLAEWVVPAYCDGCPIRDMCLSIGMTQDSGIWGGKTSRERRLLKQGQDLYDAGVARAKQRAQAVRELRS